MEVIFDEGAQNLHKIATWWLHQIDPIAKELQNGKAIDWERQKAALIKLPNLLVINADLHQLARLVS